jgi:hypothetical protein
LVIKLKDIIEGNLLSIDREKKRRIFVILLILIPLISIIFGTHGRRDYKYEFEIITTIDNEYILYIPIPVEKNGESSSIISKLKVIKGKVKTEIIDTEHGKALKIDGKGNASFKSVGKDFSTLFILGDSDIHYLSMQNNSENLRGKEYWIYYNSTANKDLSIQFNYDCSDDGVSWGMWLELKYNNKLQNAWIIVELDGGIGHWDGFGGQIICGITFILILIILIYLRNLKKVEIHAEQVRDGHHRNERLGED